MYLEQGLAVIDIYMAFCEDMMRIGGAALSISFPSNRGLLESLNRAHPYVGFLFRCYSDPDSKKRRSARAVIRGERVRFINTHKFQIWRGILAATNPAYYVKGGGKNQ